MTEPLSPAGLITNAAIQTIVAQVNDAIGPVLTISESSDGISMALAVHGAPTVALDNLTTGIGGLGGRLHIDDIPPDGLSASLFGDFTVTLTAFDLTLAQGAFVSTNIAGALTIPYFADSSGNQQTVDIEVAVRADGSLAVTLAAQQSDSSKMTPDGLVSLNYSLPTPNSSIDLEIATLEVDLDPSDGKWRLTLTGSLTLDTDGINWPEVELRGLSIDSAGHVTLQGGWIDLPSQAAIDFYGFHVALQRLGFGSDSSGDWIGFDADVNLIEGVTLGGSVRGLQVNIHTGAVSLSGVSVDFEIPGVLSFSGEIDHASVASQADLTAAGLPSNFPFPAQVFAGGVDLIIEAADDLEIDAQFIVAQVPIPIPPRGVAASPGTPTQTCFFLALDVELPAIPLFADVALYGLSGMFATNLRPNIGTATWWDWYKYPTASDGTPDISGAPDLQGDHGDPDYTATDVFKWLNPVTGAFALGAGAVIGTMDDGFTVSASIAFMIILEGPVLIFIGKANILSKRISGPDEEANFEAMATYDGNAGTFNLVIDAQYQITDVLDIQAEGELYIDPSEEVWFLALGKPPHEKRVKARILDLFEADLYFVVSNTGLVTGIWVGFQNSWSLGPLSVSINAYLAAMAAIQWSPLQLAAGVELHGEVQLSAFGISLGITADALLEATAPNSVWLYGSLSVQLSLPWPLPKVGGTVSLSWGGNGPPPPAPLALNTVSATLVDHGASDRYELLAHRAGATVNAASPADTVVYDPPPPAKPGTPGILAAQPTGYWAQVRGYGDNLAQDPSGVVPDLDPPTLANPSTLAWAALVPQDSHFALSFARAVADQAGFAGAVTPPPELVTVSPPPSSVIGADDMSNINLQPPAVQWSISQALVQVALYRYDDTATPATWDLIAATPQSPPGFSVSAPLGLAGAWVAADPVTNVPVAGTVLKVAPYTVLSGDDFTISWGGAPTTLGTSFTDQGLQFSTGPGGLAAAIAAPPTGPPTGLRFAANGDSTVTITFPSAVVLTGLSGVVVAGGEFPYSAPQVTSGGTALTSTITGLDGTTSIYTLAFDPDAAPVSEIEFATGEADLYLMSLAYTMPDINMPILPEAPGLYALKVVTMIEAGQVDGNGHVSSYQPVTDGDPVIEFAYLQCASGPGTATIDAPAVSGGFTDPLPSRQPPYSPLADAADAPASNFPEGGRLNDLATYTQWSFPADGDAAAYYGYDLNVEFNETYVNALYTTFLTDAAPYDYPGPQLPPAVHVRCVDRNQQHTLLAPVATHVPSAYAQSAIVSSAADIQQPATIAPPPAAAAAGSALAARLPAALASVLAIPGGSNDGSVSVSSVAAAQAAIAARPGSRQAARVDAAALPALGAAIAAAGLDLQPAALGVALGVNPGLRTVIADELTELAAAAQARALWFASLAPQTRYTADVVAGPLRLGDREADIASNDGGPNANGLYAVLDARDAIGALAALQAYLAEEDALTSLQRVQFTTSRYATFSDQVANVLAQTAGTAATPVRRYAVPGGTDPQTWLASAAAEQTRATDQGTYLAARQALAAVMGRFDPLFDVSQAAPLADPASGNGEQALSAQRAVTEQAWEAFSTATAATFDGLIAALGQHGLASSAQVPPPPDTELSLLTADNDLRVVALLIASPEPLCWRRMWQWTTLDPASFRARGLTGLTMLWSADETRALLVPFGSPVGAYALTLRFQGNIGAETACITAKGASVSEAATSAPIDIAPMPIHRPVVDAGPGGRASFERQQRHRPKAQGRLAGKPRQRRQRPAPAAPPPVSPTATTLSFPSVTKALTLRIRVTSGADAGRAFDLHPGELSIGREEGSEILLQDPVVSHNHAVLRVHGERVTIEDLHSTNGTKVNGMAIGRQTPLAPGDQLDLGGVILVIEQSRTAGPGGSR